MKHLILLIPIATLIIGCNESTDTAKTIEAPIDDPPPIDPPPVDPPVVGACAGDYLVGTWTFTPNPAEVMLGVQPETLTVGEDCIATSTKCGFDFEIPPEGYTAEFATGLGWDGNYNFRVSHITAPLVLNPGCQQFQNVFTAWHNCNIFPNSANSMTLSCGPLVFGNDAYNYLRQ